MMTNFNFKEMITAQNSTNNQGKVNKLNCRISQPEVLADPMVVRDLLYQPREDDLAFNFAYTYGNVRFQNGLDGKTIRWFVNGVEMPSFICEREEEYAPVGRGMSALAEEYYAYAGTNPLND